MDLDNLSGDLVAAVIRQARRVKSASRFVRHIMVVGGAAVAGIAQFTSFDRTGPTGWQIAGIAASIVVALGALFSAFADEDATENLALANRAVEEARKLSDEYRFLDTIEDDFGRLVELYQMMDICRGAIERGVSVPSLSAVEMVSRMLKACERSAPIAMGFAQKDQWTIGIYQATPNAQSKLILKCVAHHRAIPCELQHAREWESGTGIAGVAFSNKNEVVIPDLQTTGLQAVFGTNANVQKPDDVSRYRSMVAIPVLTDGSSEPWGVVTATNDRVDHFAPQRQMGLQPVEAVRALAAMTALAIACRPGGAKAALLPSGQPGPPGPPGSPTP